MYRKYVQGVQYGGQYFPPISFPFACQAKCSIVAKHCSSNIFQKHCSANSACHAMFYDMAKWSNIVYQKFEIGLSSKMLYVCKTLFFKHFSNMFSKSLLSKFYLSHTVFDVVERSNIVWKTNFKCLTINV